MKRAKKKDSYMELLSETNKVMLWSNACEALRALYDYYHPPKLPKPKPAKSPKKKPAKKKVAK